MKEKTLALFEQKFPRGEGCWEWQAGCLKTGYGVFSIQRKSVYAHRVSYELFKGPILKGNVVRHTCDNPSCVNPAHLISCTQQENIQDMYLKGRQNDVRGADSPQALLKADQIPDIRTLLAAGASTRWIGPQYSVSYKTIADVRSGRTWSHIA